MQCRVLRNTMTKYHLTLLAINSSSTNATNFTFSDIEDANSLFNAFRLKSESRKGKDITKTNAIIVPRASLAAPKSILLDLFRIVDSIDPHLASIIVQLEFSLPFLIL